MINGYDSDHLLWTDNLIKGRIAEVIFEQMMRKTERFTVIPFGYEKKTPELASHSGTLNESEAIKVIKRSPDFVLIDNERHDVLLVEVKFQTNKSLINTLNSAKQICDTWKPAYMFLATPEGFYFDPVKKIVENKGEIRKFGEKLISKEMQDEYLSIIKNHLA